MAFKGTQALMVLTTPTRLNVAVEADADSYGTKRGNGSAFVVKPHASATVYLGGPDVTTSNGYPFAPNDPPISFDLDYGEILYAIAGSSVALPVLQQGI